ncbi:lymphocyte function-associated antigen 3 isoform X2 [Petaurus breviceps papuanus]|uniref:lymphocyte function-associated antigen 3 isoform X2 n=1 Tax=Petaurus breviceps papuanus TaxID=3040969 RepID=UPI0036DCD322
MAREFCGMKILLPFALGQIILFNLGRCEPVKMYGVINSNITLSPLQKAKFKDITWKKGKDKVAEWQENEEIRYFGSFQGRAILDPSGNFTILNLTTSDEGLYEMESTDNHNPANETMLYVLENLLQPDLYCSFDGENLTVSCNGSKDSRFLNYAWDFSGSYVNLSESKVQLRYHENLHQNISCIIKNPKSTNGSSLLLETCVPKKDQRKYRYLLLIGAFIYAIVFPAGLYASKNIRSSSHSVIISLLILASSLGKEMDRSQDDNPPFSSYPACLVRDRIAAPVASTEFQSQWCSLAPSL